MFPATDNDALKRTVVAGLALVAFFFPVSIAASSLAFFPLLALYVAAGSWTFRRWPPAWGRVEIAFLLFWGVSLLSAGFSDSPSHSRGQLTEDLYVILIPLLGALLVNEPGLRSRLLKWFLWGGLLTAVCGLLQAVLGMDQNERTGRVLQHIPSALAGWPESLLRKLSLNDGRATGFRGHPLTFAETLLFPLAMMLSQLAMPSRIIWRKWAPMTGILIGALLASQSRGPWLAFGVMTLSLVILEPKPHVWRRLGILVACPAALILFTPALRHRALSIGDTRFSSNSERLMMWEAGSRMLRDHPLLGVGPGHVRLASPSYQTPRQRQAFGAWGHLHNTYVHIAAERGLLGLGAFLVFIGMLGGRLLRAYRRPAPGSGEQRTLLLTALLGLIGWLASGLTEAVYNNSSIQMMFYFVMGLALASLRGRDYSRA